MGRLTANAGADLPDRHRPPDNRGTDICLHNLGILALPVFVLGPQVLLSADKFNVDWEDVSLGSECCSYCVSEFGDESHRFGLLPSTETSLASLTSNVDRLWRMQDIDAQYSRGVFPKYM